MLLELPVELLLEVLKALSLEDLPSLSRVSRQLHAYSLPFLYQCVTVHVDERFEVRRQSWHLLNGDASRFRFTKQFVFESPYAFVPGSRGTCPHSVFIFDDSDDHVADPTGNMLETVEIILLRYLERLPRDLLGTFKWNMRSCVPKSLIEYLLEHQRGLESLHLITDSMCKANIDGVNTRYTNVDVTWNNLQTFRWKGIRSIEDVETIRNTLIENYSSLRDLSISIDDWEETTGDWFLYSRTPTALGYPKFFAGQVLRVKKNDLTCRFPLLTRLSLSRVQFEVDDTEIFSAFNFAGLRSLRLWKCDCIEEILTILANWDQHGNLECFELVQDPTENWDFEDSSLAAFLASLKGLRFLYLMFPLPAPYWDDICRSIGNHVGTLEHLIVHGVTIDINEKSERFEECCDIETEWNGAIVFACWFPYLDCLGTTNNGKYLADGLRTSSPSRYQPAFRILHIRRSRKADELPNDRRQKSLSPVIMDELRKGLVVASPNEEVDGIDDEEDGHGDDGDENESETDNEDTDLDSDDGPPYDNSSAIAEDQQDLEYLANWAFGPEGLRNLQIIAYGDFSSNGYYRQHTRLLCRMTPNVDTDTSSLSSPYFRDVAAEDHRLHELVRDNMSMLSACSADED